MKYLSDLQAIKLNPYALYHVREQKNEICLEAVKLNGNALQFVKNQINEICLEAVKQDGFALQYVKEQTEEICLEAVKQNVFALEYIKEQTNKICLEAVKQNGYALEYVKEKTNEICLEAVKQNCVVLQYLREQTGEMCLEAFTQNRCDFSYVKEQLIEERCVKISCELRNVKIQQTIIARVAIADSNGCVLRYVKNQTVKICLEAVKHCIKSLKYVDIKYVKFIRKYLESVNFKRLGNNYKFIINKNLNDFMKYYNSNKFFNGWGIKYLKQNLDLCKLITGDNKYLSYINYKKLKLCLQIIKTFNKGFEYINKQYIEVLL